MKNIIVFALGICMVAPAVAQKKLIPVSQSSLTGITLPAGSKQDSRLLSTAGAKMLLEIESDKANVALSATEVLVIPPTPANGFTSDSLIKNLTALGWAVSIVPGDKKYAWLQKENRYFLMYASMDVKETAIYFAKATSAPKSHSLKGSTLDIIRTSNTQKNPTQPVPPATSSAFAFTTTNFDDGWTSTVKENWVEVSKGNIVVLLHYPNKAADAHNFVLLDGLKNAWDVLVAHRYSSATNMQFRSSGSWESIEFGEADLVQNATGNMVYVVLFKKNFSSGSGRYIEFISPDKKSFEHEFGTFENASANYGTGTGFDKMANMVTYNKFAVSAADLKGNWTSNFTGMTQYVNAYTGANAGANTHASNESFEFGPGNNYKWNLGVASGFVGSIKFQSVKSSGTFTMPNNWQVKFSDIEGKPKTDNVQFVCIKGARVLWIGDSGFGKKD